MNTYKVNDIIRSDSRGQTWMLAGIVTAVSENGETLTVRDLRRDFTTHEIPATDVTKVRTGDVTDFEYMYRDGSNYKTYTKATFAGVITAEDLRKILDKGDVFIPEVLGLGNPRDDYDNYYDDDGAWCEIVAFTIRAARRYGETYDEKIADFAERFAAAEFTQEAAETSLAAFVAGRHRGGGDSEA